MKANLKDMSKGFSRRQILKSTGTFLIGLTTTSFFTFLMTKNESKAQAIVVEQPNEFELQGEDTQIAYSVSSGVPQLDYKSQDISLSFSGEEIQTLTTDFGTVITVIISRPNSDLSGNLVKLSLLLPIVNLLPLGGEASIQTFAIVTTQKTVGNKLVIPLFGQIQNYQTLVLNGTARLVLGD